MVAPVRNTLDTPSYIRTYVLQSSDHHRLPAREFPPLDMGDSAAHTHTVHSLLYSREDASDTKYAEDDDLPSLETELGLPSEQTESGLLFSDPYVKSSANRCACPCNERAVLALFVRFRPNTARVSNPRPASLCYVVRGHICKLRIYYENYTII
jgi:hypothetical protein